MRNLKAGLCPFHICWVPHISLVFCEMWETTNLNLSYVGPGIRRPKVVVSHISQKTSEMWGTQHMWKGHAC
jgi:hypothetical protein